MSSSFSIVLRVAAVVSCAAFGLLGTITSALAQNYPTKPVRLIVPFPPGGGTDIVARVIAVRATESLGQSVVVDNRAGGGGTIGAETAVRANPDGYTLAMVSASYATNPALYKLPYDAVKDIQAIVMVGQSGWVLALNPAVPIKSLKEFVAYNRANPAKLNYGSTGTGGATHLATELFDLMAGTKMTHIPYKGTGPALNDLIGGQIQVMFGAMPSAIPQVKAGRLRALGVTTSKRVGALSDVPAISEAVPGYEAVTWYGVLGPKGLPKDVVARWNGEVARILQTDEMKSRMAVEAIDPAGGPPEEFLNVIRRDVEKWTKVVKAANITLAN
jgi:tripartite-type tricarboxylate transporter receptor subunit TctC